MMIQFLSRIILISIFLAMSIVTIGDRIVEIKCKDKFDFNDGDYNTK